MIRLLSLKSALVAVFCVAFASAATSQERPRVVTVNYALQYLAERIVEDAADVLFPVPADVDPSFWRPSISDISMIQSADVILLNGAGFATWVDRVSLPRSKVVDTSVHIQGDFIVTESITHSHGDGGEHSHEGLASYTWLDPTLALAQARRIGSAFPAYDLMPPNVAMGRGVQLSRELEALDAEISATLAGLDGVAIIATHPRYQYFARRYNLAITALDWDAGAAPTPAQLDALAAEVAETGATILIWEAAPPEAAKSAVAALGLANVVFPPMAHAPPGDLTYPEVLQKAARDLAAAHASTSN